LRRLSSQALIEKEHPDFILVFENG